MDLDGNFIGFFRSIHLLIDHNVLLFNHKYRDRGYAVSYGLAAFGEPIAEAAKAVLREKGITSADNHRSAPVTEEVVAAAAAVIAMTPSHAMQLMLSFPEAASKIRVMPKPIADPFGGSLDVYRHCLTEIDEGLSLLFDTSPGEATE